MNIDPIILRDLIAEHERDIHRGLRHTHEFQREPGRARRIAGNMLIRLGERLTGRMNQPLPVPVVSSAPQTS